MALVSWEAPADRAQNRLTQRGYYEKVADIIRELAGMEPGMQTTEVHEHGLLGPVRLVREAPSP